MSEQPYKTRRLLPAEVKAALAAACQVATEDCPRRRPQVIAEYLREGLCAFRQLAADTPSSPVHILRLLTSVRRQLSFWLVEGEEPEDPVRSVLDVLADLGDAADAGRGLYYPTPIRRVDLPQTCGAVLIGSLPTRQLEELWGARGRVRAAGLARVCRPEDIGVLPAAIPRQALDRWLGLDEPDLVAWTAERLRVARARLRPASGDVGPFHIYLPEVTPGEPQHFRWLAPERWAVWAEQRRPFSHRLYLCKRQDGYSLARLRQAAGGSHITVLQETPVTSADVRRLRYGLDERAKCPVVVTFRDEPHGRTIVELRSPLPPQEHRLLTALALPIPHSKVWPLRFQLEQTLKPVMLGALTRLHIVVSATTAPERIPRW